MKHHISRLLAIAGVATLISTACSVDPEQAGQAAERVMTVAAQITPGAVETVMASSPLGTPAPAAPAEAPIVYARCITRGETALRQEPSEDATEMAALSNRTIITAYGRTADGNWVLGWDAGKVDGWLPASIIGCTAPVQELRATDAGVLLTPTAEVIAESTLSSTIEETVSPPATEPAEASTGTPEPTLEPLATLAPEATATESIEMTPEILPTTMSIATITPEPTEAQALPTLAPATTQSDEPARVITVVVTATPAQVRDLRCTVTPGTPVNLRGGPARTENLLGSLPAGTRFLAQGRNENASWLYGFTERQTPGWLIASSVECDGDPAQLVEVDR